MAQGELFDDPVTGSGQVGSAARPRRGSRRQSQDVAPWPGGPIVDYSVTVSKTGDMVQAFTQSDGRVIKIVENVGERWAIGNGEGPLRIADLNDDGLARYRRDIARQIEDGGRGEPMWKLEHWATQAKNLRLSRFALRMRYGARDNGTHNYDRYERLGHAPSYELALALDKARFDHGMKHILDWASVAA